MANNNTVWPITRHYLTNEANHLFQGDQASSDAWDYCVKFSTWYFAVNDRASQSAIESMQSVADLAARVGVAYEPPSVNVFRLAKDIADAFLQGYVPPEKLVALESESENVIAGASPVIDAIDNGKGDIAFGTL